MKRALVARLREVNPNTEAQQSQPPLLPFLHTYLTLQRHPEPAAGPSFSSAPALGRVRLSYRQAAIYGHRTRGEW